MHEPLSIESERVSAVGPKREPSDIELWLGSPLGTVLERMRFVTVAGVPACRAVR